jgi:hypothetical protein
MIITGLFIEDPFIVSTGERSKKKKPARLLQAAAPGKCALRHSTAFAVKKLLL